MERIAIVVEPTFMSTHVGVRNIIGSLKKLLERHSCVDWITYSRDRRGLRWLRMSPHQPTLFERVGFDDSLVIQGSPKTIAKSFESQFQQAPKLSPQHFYYSDIGSSLQRENYDLVLISAPWLDIHDTEIRGPRVVGFVHDTTPCQYCFTREHKPFDFAREHAGGFQHYQRVGTHVVANSAHSAEAYNRFFGAHGPRAEALPPLAPAWLHAPPKLGERNSRTLALSSPFDLRKGLRQMPQTLNRLADVVDEVAIYGGIRCTHADVQQFFQELELPRVKWWPSASVAQVRKILSGSGALFFPSFEEGLGLPILEAQMCGCPTLVRNRQPMKSLLTSFSRTFEEDGGDAETALREILKANASASAIQQAAYELLPPDLCETRFRQITESPLRVRRAA